MTFTRHELDYLRGQRLARLATLAPDGTLQNNPVAFFVHASAGTIDIGGARLLQTRKFRNVQSHPQVALVIDDLASVDPWRPRCLEIRGRAEALPDADRRPAASARASSGSTPSGSSPSASTRRPAAA